MGSIMLAVLVLLVQELQGLKHCPKEEAHITVNLGGTAYLPCSFSPSKPVNKEGVQVSWQKEESEMDLVVHFQNGKQEGDQQDERFRGRTLVDRSWFLNGNAKLSLQSVTEKDSGTYTCWITLLPLRPSTQYKCCVVTLATTEDKTQMMGRADENISMNPVIGWSLVLLSIGLMSCTPCLLTAGVNPFPFKKKNGIL